MKKYVCDSCGRIIPDPHHERMKEFSIGVDYGDRAPVLAKRKIKIHLCDKCFHGLYSIVEKQEKWDNNVLIKTFSNDGKPML